MATKHLTPIQSIKKYCKEECSAGERDNWVNCSCIKCPLFPFRLGKRPNRLPFQEYTQKHRDLRTNSTKNEVLQDTSKGNEPEPNTRTEELAELSEEVHNG